MVPASSGNQPHSTKRDSADLWSTAKNVAFLTGIYLYFLGWMYLYLYFRHFGVSLLSLDVPVTFFFVYSYPVLAPGFTLAKASVGAVILLMILATVITWAPFHRFRGIALALLTFVLFLISFQVAKESAEVNAIGIRQGHGAKGVRLTFNKEAARSLPAAFVDANEKRELLLLLETKDRLYIVHQPTTAESTEIGELPMASLYILDHSSVAIADVDVINASIRE